MFVVNFVAWLLSGIGIALCALVVLLLLEISVGCYWTPAPPANLKPPAKFAVIVPAHNEADHIADVLRAIQSDIRPQDRLLVVADNCLDNTYDAARSTGAEVIRRDDQLRRGKGFALDCAIKHLAADPPDVVLVMDADCYASKGSLARLASYAAAYNRPVQGQYEMLSPPGEESAALATAAFSYRVKATMRPLGMQRLGGPCTLMGTGMAFPWATIERANLATSQIVEDLLMSLEFTREGKAPLYCYDAKITSTFPATVEGQKIQRERWESGHVNVILQVLPRMAAASITTGNVRLLAMIADTAIPPLALLAILVVIQLAASSILAVFGGPLLPIVLGVVNSIAFFSAIVIAWRTAFPGKGIGTMLVKVPGYILGKLGIYLKVLMRRRIEWVRTQRD